jgi:MoaA/NifB/PqqE/SkfB family radical SAM enzyme
MDLVEAVQERLAAQQGDQLADLPIPEPVPDLQTYLRERELCLSLSPQRRANYEAYLRSSRREAVVSYVPIRLDIENVSRCNFRCTMCQVSEWPKGKRAADMSLDDYKKLIDEQYGLVEVKIQGFGEPTMGGESYFEMIKYARARHIWVRTITNASRLHLRDCYKKLIDSDVNEIQISIDGATKEVFEGIRHGSVFERVVANCKLINAYAAQKGIVRTKMWTVVQKSNVHQLSDLVDLAQGTGFKTLVFSFELTDFGMPHWREKNDLVSVSDQIDIGYCRRLLRRAQSYGIKLGFWIATDRYDTKGVDNLCPWPFERAYVSSDMRFVPCCIIGNPEISDVGDARRLMAEWNGDAIVEFRKAHLEGRIPAVCRSCYK